MGSQQDSSSLVDPKAAKFLGKAIKELLKVLPEAVRLHRFADLVKQKGLLAYPASADDLLLVALDIITFHLRYVQDDPEYQDKYTQAFRMVNSQTTDLTEWYNAIDTINREIRVNVTRDRDPDNRSEEARNRHKETLKAFQNDEKEFLLAIKNDRLDDLNHGLGLRVTRSHFQGNVQGGLNSQNVRINGGAVHADVHGAQIGGDVRGGINSKIWSVNPSTNVSVPDLDWTA